MSFFIISHSGTTTRVQTYETHEQAEDALSARDLLLVSPFVRKEDGINIDPARWNGKVLVIKGETVSPHPQVTAIKWVIG